MCGQETWACAQWTLGMKAAKTAGSRLNRKAYEEKLHPMVGGRLVQGMGTPRTAQELTARRTGVMRIHRALALASNLAMVEAEIVRLRDLRLNEGEIAQLERAACEVD